MNLKLRLGGLLQSGSNASGQDAPDSEALARAQKRREEEAHQRHLQRLRAARNRELDQLRRVMVERRSASATADSPQAPRHGMTPATVTRPPTGVDGSQLVSLINELEIKVLSEPMGLHTLLQRQAQSTPTSASTSRHSRSQSVARTRALDDAALLVAARRWEPAADMLLKAIHMGELTEGASWATRCAIDLLVLGEQPVRAQALRQQFIAERGRTPSRLIPQRPPGSDEGRILPGHPRPWRCPAQMDAIAAEQVEALLTEHRPEAGPVVMDWRYIERFDPTSSDIWCQTVRNAMRKPMAFIHLGLGRLVKTLRCALQTQARSQDAWRLWLMLLNWAGFRNAHHLAGAAYARHFGDTPDAYAGARCICHPFNTASTQDAARLVRSMRLEGDLARDRADELARAEFGPVAPGSLFLLDLRSLTSVDFFFGTDLLNWTIHRHGQGEAVTIAYAHPLLALFLQTLGIHDYAKLHGLPIMGDGANRS